MTEAKAKPIVRKYRLKAMVLARVFAEISVLILLVALPILIQVMGKMSLLPIGGKAVLIGLAIIALCVLPFFGYITYQVNTDDAGITTLALLSKHSCLWHEVKALTRKSSNSWVRYVVEHDGGELSFSPLLRSADVLVQEIRAHLPDGSGIASNPYRMFQSDPSAFMVQCVQSLAGIVFVCIGWFLFAGTTSKAGHSGDAEILFGFCAVCTLVFIWRTVVVALMPKTVELTRDQLIVRTYFSEQRYPWGDVKSVSAPFPLLPEGFLIKTKKFSYLVGSGMEAGDELEEAIKAKVTSNQPAQK
jgi:hypothetical protein